MDAFGTAISLCLQYGVPVNELCHKFAHSRFEPSGFTKNSDIPMAKSIVDYIFRWLNLTFPDGKATFARGSASDTIVPELPEAATKSVSATTAKVTGADGNLYDHVGKQFEEMMEDAPCCDVCGSITVRNGSCYRCHNCGNSMGCS
jgi:ribonucleoside-diphosphate reductase alpha chain